MQSQRPLPMPQVQHCSWGSGGTYSRSGGLKAYSRSWAEPWWGSRGQSNKKLNKRKPSESFNLA